MRNPPGVSCVIPTRISQSCGPVLTHLLCQTIAQAKQLEPGTTVDKLSHKFEIRNAALHRQLEAYSGMSPWFFVLTFLMTVGAVIVAFFYAKGVWSKRQDLAAATLQ